MAWVGEMGHLWIWASNRRLPETLEVQPVTKKHFYFRFLSTSRPKIADTIDNTVDGSEIRQSPLEVGSLSIPLFTGFLYIPGGFLAGFLNHQQYHSRDSWMYPYQRTPMGQSLKKTPYLVGIYGLEIPKNP